MIIESNKNQGYAVLFIVIIVNAAALAVVTSIMVWGFYFHKTSLVQMKSAQAKYIADACSEIGLQDVRDNESITGSFSLNIGEGSCNYNISGVSPNKTIESEGLVDDVYRRVVVNIDQINPTINISAWQEVSNF